MTRLELTDLIDNKKKSLQRPYPKGAAYDFMKDFVKGKEFTDPLDFYNADITKFIQSLYYIRCNRTDISGTNKKLNEFLPFLLELDEDSFCEFMNMSINFYKDGELPKIIEYFDEENFIAAKILLSNIYPNNKEDRKFVERLRKISSIKRNNSLATFFRMLNREYKTLLDLMSLLHVYKAIEKIKKRFDSSEVYSSKGKLSNEDRKQQLNSILDNLVDMKEVNKDYSKVFNFVADVLKKEEKYKRNNEREIERIDKAVNLLDEALTKDEVVNPSNIIKGIKEEELRFAILSVIYNHNMIGYEKLEKEFQILSEDGGMDYQLLLEKYNLTSDENFVASIRHNSLNDVESILDFVTGLNFEDNQVISILQRTNLTIVEQIKKFINNGVFTVNFLDNNMDLFYINSPKFNLFMDNIVVFNRYSINPSMFKSNEDVLLEDTRVLDGNLEVLAKYDLLEGMKNVLNFEFLTVNDLCVRIDKLLELGYEQILKNCLELLNFSNFKRLEVLKAIGVTDLSLYDVLNTLNGKFFLDEDSLDDYIPSIVKYRGEIELNVEDTDLEGYKVSDNVYSINNVLVSRQKVLRLLELGYSLYEAIVSGLNLSAEEYELLSLELGQLKMLKWYSKRFDSFG